MPSDVKGQVVCTATLAPRKKLQKIYKKILQNYKWLQEKNSLCDCDVLHVCVFIIIIKPLVVNSHLYILAHPTNHLCSSGVTSTEETCLPSSVRLV